MSTTLKLPLESLKLNVDLTGIDLPEATRLQSGILGQSRAQSALEFGIAMPNPGYNIFVMGETGLGRLTMVTNHLDVVSQTMPSPSSYVYVDNFENTREPVAIELPAEYGQIFCKDIEKLLDDLLATFPAAFESPAYQQKNPPSNASLASIIIRLLTLLIIKPKNIELPCLEKANPLRLHLSGKTNPLMKNSSRNYLNQSERNFMRMLKLWKNI